MNALQPGISRFQDGAAGQRALDAEVVLLSIGVWVGGLRRGNGQTQERLLVIRGALRRQSDPVWEWVAQCGIGCEAAILRRHPRSADGVDGGTERRRADIAIGREKVDCATHPHDPFVREPVSDSEARREKIPRMRCNSAAAIIGRIDESDLPKVGHKRIRGAWLENANAVVTFVERPETFPAKTVSKSKLAVDDKL